MSAVSTAPAISAFLVSWYQWSLHYQYQWQWEAKLVFGLLLAGVSPTPRQHGEVRSDTKFIWCRTYLILNYLIPNLFDTELNWCWTYYILNLLDITTLRVRSICWGGVDGAGEIFFNPTLPQAMLSGLVVIVGCWTAVARCEGLAVSVSCEGVRGLKKGKSKSYNILSI